MIDTDKYEGHTRGPWKIYYDKWNRSGWWIDSIARGGVGEYGDTVCRLHGTAQNKDPTAKLIQDAPLLLAEVKRLRGLLKITAQSYLDDVRAEDMLGEVSVKKEYETCQEIADVLGVSIVSGHTLHDMFHANGSEFGRYFVYLDEDGEMVMMND